MLYTTTRRPFKANLAEQSTEDDRTLVGLGFSGIFKEDGSPFDGLGILPRRAREIDQTGDYVDLPSVAMNGVQKDDVYYESGHAGDSEIDLVSLGTTMATDTITARRIFRFYIV